MTNSQIDKFQREVNYFIAVIRNYTGANPVFEFDYSNGYILLHDASSGLIKRLHDEGAITHLHNGKLSVSWIGLPEATIEEVEKGFNYTK
jgi:hypothetical protein